MTKYKDEFELISKIETKIIPSITECYPYEWNEDFITLSLLKSIRKNFHCIDYFGWQETDNIHWSAYKCNGTIENKYGDIGVLVKLIYKDGRVLEGVGFIEAKRRYVGKLTFDAIKLPQLKRITTNFPYSYTMLYDYEPITGFVANYSIPPNDEKSRGLASTPYTHALVVQSHTILATTAKDKSLYKHGMPFSYLLVNRYFNGMDLNFDKKTIEDIKGFHTEKSYVSYLMNVTVYEPGTNFEEKPSINLNMYTEV